MTLEAGRLWVLEEKEEFFRVIWSSNIRTTVC